MAKFIPTKAQRDEAAATAKELGLPKLYITKDGHYFTEHNRALLNVSNVQDDVAVFTFELDNETPVSPELKAAKMVLVKTTKAFENATSAKLKAADKLKASPEDEKLKAACDKADEALKTAEAEHEDALAEVDALTETGAE
jgi:hypothetical protein